MLWAIIKKTALALAILTVAALGLSRKTGFLSILVGNVHYAAAQLCSNKNVSAEVIKNGSETEDQPAFFLMGCGGFLN